MGPRGALNAAGLWDWPWHDTAADVAGCFQWITAKTRLARCAISGSISGASGGAYGPRLTTLVISTHQRPEPPERAVFLCLKGRAPTACAACRIPPHPCTVRPRLPSSAGGRSRVRDTESIVTTPTHTAPAEPPLLLGLEAIAGFLGMTPRQLRQIASKGDVPLFKLKRSGLLAARPESLRAWLTAEEAAAFTQPNRS